MKKLLFISVFALAFASSGCQNAELDNCKSENAELREKNQYLEQQMGESLKVIEALGQKIGQK